MRILKKQQNEPILVGKIKPHKNILTKELAYSIDVWCPYCHKYHTHGWDISYKTPSHRGAHCKNNESPFINTGYYIMPEKDNH